MKILKILALAVIGLFVAFEVIPSLLREKPVVERPAASSDDPPLMVSDLYRLPSGKLTPYDHTMLNARFDRCDREWAREDACDRDINITSDEDIRSTMTSVQGERVRVFVRAFRHPISWGGPKMVDYSALTLSERGDWTYYAPPEAKPLILSLKLK